MPISSPKDPKNTNIGMYVGSLHMAIITTKDKTTIGPRAHKSPCTRNAKIKSRNHPTITKLQYKIALVAAIRIDITLFRMPTT